jgi:precorrin-8X/cobalt-precorrin-8 methylmutase
VKKALLIIDRGSKMNEVREELLETCNIIKKVSDYSIVEYCFLEVVPPFIDQGIKTCIEKGADSITIVPYFLYPGMKLKDAVTKTAAIISEEKIRMVVTKPLSYQPTIPKIVIDRLQYLLKDKKIDPTKNICLLLIGHGSSDRRARDAFIYTVKSLEAIYPNVRYCFLELEPPDINEGYKNCVSLDPDYIIVVPYFLHKGIHIQRDILVDLEKARENYGQRDIYISSHIGVNDSIVDLVIYLAKEAEMKSGLF